MPWLKVTFDKQTKKKGSIEVCGIVGVRFCIVKNDIDIQKNFYKYINH